MFAKLIFAGQIFAILGKIAKNSPAKMFQNEAIAKISPAQHFHLKDNCKNTILDHEMSLKRMKFWKLLLKSFLASVWTMEAVLG